MTTIIEFVTPYLDKAIANGNNPFLWEKVKEKFLETVTDKEIKVLDHYDVDYQAIHTLADRLNNHLNSTTSGWIFKQTVKPTRISKPFMEKVERFVAANSDEVSEWWNQHQTEQPFITELNIQGELDSRRMPKNCLLTVIAILISQKSHVQYLDILDRFKQEN